MPHKTDFNNTENCIAFLNSHGIKPTANRITLLKLLAAANTPLSLTDLEMLSDTIDKSNIFRTLTIFKEKKAVHVLEDGNGNARYEICLAQHSDECSKHEDSHIHFFCEQCRKTFCFENVPVPEIELPEDFIFLSANFLVKGICPKCAAKNGHKQKK